MAERKVDGIEPAKLFFWRYTSVSCVAAANEGKFPDSPPMLSAEAWLERSKCLRFESDSMLDGSVPLKSLKDRSLKETKSWSAAKKN